MRPCGQGLTHLQVLGSRPSGTSAHFSTSAVTSQVFKVLQDMNSIKPCAPTLLTTSILSLVAGFPPSSFLSRSPQDFHPDKVKPTCEFFMDFDMGRLEMRHNTFVYYRDQISANLHRFILNSGLNASIGSAVK